MAEASLVCRQQLRPCSFIVAFSLPRSVDDLFKFLTHWVPDRYGPLRDVTAQGYELIDSDTEWDDDESRPHKVSERVALL